MGVAVCGTPPEPQHVRQKLIDNPSFARSCGFTLHAGAKLPKVIGVTDMLLGDGVLDVKGEVGRCFLWNHAVFAPISRTSPDKFAQPFVHATPGAWLGSVEPSTE